VIDRFEDRCRDGSGNKHQLAEHARVYLAVIRPEKHLQSAQIILNQNKPYRINNGDGLSRCAKEEIFHHRLISEGS
jgi:hypothetical protein